MVIIVSPQNTITIRPNGPIGIIGGIGRTRHRESSWGSLIEEGHYGGHGPLVHLSPDCLCQTYRFGGTGSMQWTGERGETATVCENRKSGHSFNSTSSRSSCYAERYTVNRSYYGEFAGHGKSFDLINDPTSFTKNKTARANMSGWTLIAPTRTRELS